MKDTRLERFTQIIENHMSSKHPLFDVLEDAARESSVTTELYSIFAVNIATRTMLSLSEIHACCIQASLDLNPLRTAYGVMTGAEEGGSGKPSEVHSTLMMNALNYHGQVVFNMKPIDVQYQMALIRLLHITGKYKVINKLEESYPGISVMLKDTNIFDTSKIQPTFERLCYYTKLIPPPDFESDKTELENFRKAIEYAIYKTGVVKATVDYCLEQLEVLNNPLEGYLQGVAYAHECLADGMIYKMFCILFAQIDRYKDESEFLNIVYPYFSAHGNYMDVYNGSSEETEGVEATHALREFEKLSELDDSALQFALKGADDFANRNTKIWDELLQLIQPIIQKALNSHYILS